MKIRSPAKLRQKITDQHAASITESLLRTDCCWLGFFGKVYWPTPFNMHFDFCPLLRITFEELSRKYPYSQTPAISRKSEHQGPWCLALAKLGNLATACGACFLRLQTASLGSDSGRCKDVLQDHGVWLSRSLAFGSSAATYEGQGGCPQAPPHRELNQNQTKILWCPSPAGPRAAVGGSPLHNNYNIQLSRNFRKKHVTFANSKETFAKVSNITCTAFAIKTPYQGPLDRSPYIYMYIYRMSCESKHTYISFQFFNGLVSGEGSSCKSSHIFPSFKPGTLKQQIFFLRQCSYELLSKLIVFAKLSKLGYRFWGPYRYP